MYAFSVNSLQSGYMTFINIVTISSITLTNKTIHLLFSYNNMSSLQRVTTEVTLCFVLSQAGTESTLYSSLQTLPKNYDEVPLNFLQNIHQLKIYS